MTPTPHSSDADPAHESRQTARFVIVAALILLAGWMASGYLVAVGWALLIAIASWPLYARLARRMTVGPRRIAAPLIFTLLILLVFLIPLSLLTFEAARESRLALDWLAEVQKNGVAAPEWLSNIPLVGVRAEEWWRTHLADPTQAQEFFGGIDTGTLAQLSRDVGGGILQRMLLALVMIMTLFFLYRDGRHIAERAVAVIGKWLGDSGRRLASDLATTIRGIVSGMLLLAVGDGAVLTTGYFMTGVPYPLLFGGATTALAMIPMGAWVAFATASLVLLAQGNAGAAIVLAVFGVVVMLTSDNVVQPAIVGGVAHLPLPAALIGVLGGVQTFGLIGIFLGPVIMAALLAVWREWIDPEPDAKTT